MFPSCFIKPMIFILSKKMLILVVNIAYFLILEHISIFAFANINSNTDVLLAFFRSFHLFALFCILWLVVFFFRFLILFIHHIFLSSCSFQNNYSLCTVHPDHIPKQTPFVICPNYQWFTVDLFHIQLQSVSQTSSSGNNSDESTTIHQDVVFHVNPWTYFTYLHLFGMIVFVLMLSLNSLFPISFCVVALIWTLMVPFIFQLKQDLSKSISTNVFYLTPIATFVGLVCIIVHVSQNEIIPNGNAPIEQLNFLYICLFLIVLPVIFAILFLKLQTDLHRFDVDINTLFNFLLPSIAGISLFYLFLYAYVLNIVLILKADQTFPQTIQYTEVHSQWIFFFVLPILFFSMTF